MESDRISQAIERIEAAANRISAADGKLSVSATGDNELAAKHEALRHEVSQTLSKLDELIEGFEQ